MAVESTNAILPFHISCPHSVPPFASMDNSWTNPTLFVRNFRWSRLIFLISAAAKVAPPGTQCLWPTGPDLYPYFGTSDALELCIFLLVLLITSAEDRKEREARYVRRCRPWHVFADFKGYREHFLERVSDRQRNPSVMMCLHIWRKCSLQAALRGLWASNAMGQALCEEADW